MSAADEAALAGKAANGRMGAALAAVNLMADWRNSTELSQVRAALQGGLHIPPETKTALEELKKVKLDVGQFMAPLLEIAKAVELKKDEAVQWKKSLEGFNDSLKLARESSWVREFSETLASIQANYGESARRLEGHAREAQGLAKWLSAQLEAVKRSIKLPIFDFEAYEARERRSIRIAASYGWFLQPEAHASVGGDITQYAECPATLDLLFVQLLELSMADIETRLTSEYPNLAHIFREAFALHREGRYLASVPLLFLGADAISLAQTNTSVFSQSRKQTKHKRRIQVTEWVEGKDVSVGMDAFFELLCSPHPLNLHTLGILNRHKVMHGEDVNYHSKENSLRAMSFLGFVGWLLSPKSQHLTEPTRLTTSP